MQNGKKRVLLIARKTIKDKVLERIAKLQGSVLLLEDIRDLGSSSQINKVLKVLIAEEVITRLGYGVYGKLKYSELLGESYLLDGPLITFREALTRLDVKWEPSDFEQDYNEGRSTQIPVNPPTKVLSKFNRKLSYKGRNFRVQKIDKKAE